MLFQSFEKLRFHWRLVTGNYTVHQLRLETCERTPSFQIFKMNFIEDDVHYSLIGSFNGFGLSLTWF